jgi:hypothetical protein
MKRFTHERGRRHHVAHRAHFKLTEVDVAKRERLWRIPHKRPRHGHAVQRTVVRERLRMHEDFSRQAVASGQRLRHSIEPCAHLVGLALYLSQLFRRCAAHWLWLRGFRWRVDAERFELLLDAFLERYDFIRLDVFDHERTHLARLLFLDSPTRLTTQATIPVHHDHGGRGTSRGSVTRVRQGN